MGKNEKIHKVWCDFHEVLKKLLEDTATNISKADALTLHGLERDHSRIERYLKDLDLAITLIAEQDLNRANVPLSASKVSIANCFN